MDWPLFCASWLHEKVCYFLSFRELVTACCNLRRKNPSWFMLLECLMICLASCMIQSMHLYFLARIPVLLSWSSCWDRCCVLPWPTSWLVQADMLEVFLDRGLDEASGSSTIHYTLAALCMPADLRPRSSLRGWRSLEIFLSGKPSMLMLCFDSTRLMW